MGFPVIISGFPSSNRVPGAYGEVLTGQQGQSAAGLPKRLLVVGLALSGGQITPDVQVQQILSTADADNYAGAGSEGACMLYDALGVAGQQGVPIDYCSPKPAAGATAATVQLRVTGTATAAGAIAVRINGLYIQQGIAIGDTGAQVCTNLASTISGKLGGRLPVSATAATNYCTLQCRTPGQRGMQVVVFSDTSQLPAGISAQLYATWVTLTPYLVGDNVINKTVGSAAGMYFKCTTAGTTGASEPTWPTTVGATVTDGTVVWTNWGATATGSVPTQAVFLGNGTGLETYTNLLATLASIIKDYRVALAANDAVSDGAWKTQIDQYAAAPYNALEQVVVASNGTNAAAVSLAQTTLNDTRFGWLWELNAETHPSRLAAQFAAIRCLNEGTNPNTNYDGLILPYAAAQSQPADWPTLAVLISSINNSVTPVGSQAGDGYSRVCRAITTKSLTGGSADYSTIDVQQMNIYDFVLLDSKLYWSSKIQPNNPVNQDNPPAGARQPPSGVMTPDRAVAAFFDKLTQYSKGILFSTPVSGSAQVPPIVIAPVPGDVTANYDPVANRIMVAENVRAMPLLHQVGISVRGA